MARKFTHWDLVRCFLELEDLLINKLTSLMRDNVGVQRALFLGGVTRLPLAAAPPG
jgi:hypothetical protein